MLKFTANLSLLFTEYDFLDRFKAAKEHGFTAVEIQFPYAFPVQKIKQALSENQLQLVLFNVDADDLLEGGEGLAAVPEKKSLFLKALKQSRTYADILKPELINILPGRCSNPESNTTYLNTFIQNLSIALDTFSPLGIKTVFEAINTEDMPGFIVHGGHQMLQILDQLNHPMLSMQYDVYHMHKMKENPVQFIQQHTDKIGHIQFADVPGRNQPGTGLINFDLLFSAIKKSTYSGWVGAEYRPLKSTQQSLDWLSKFNPKLIAHE